MFNGKVIRSSDIKDVIHIKVKVSLFSNNLTRFFRMNIQVRSYSNRVNQHLNLVYLGLAVFNPVCRSGAVE